MPHRWTATERERGGVVAQRVLVVDDEERIRELLADFLATEGYEVILSSNGEEAIELVEREDPQVILLDVQMNGIDGIEVCKRLKANKKTGLIPVIMMTALGDYKTKAFEAGADDCVYKPCDLGDLLVRVKSILRVGHLTDPTERQTAYMEELEKNILK